MKKTNKKFEKYINNPEKADTSKKQIEESLRESEEKYQTLTENIALGIFKSPPDPKGSFIEVNSAFVKMLGYRNKKELLQINTARIYQNPKDRLKLIEKISKKRSIKNEELYLKKKDGTAIIVSETVIAVHNKNGKILYFYGVVEDITQRKKAEEDLLIQKAYFERLFNNAPEAIVLHDNNDLIADINAEFTKMYGYSREEAIGKPINDLVASEDFQNEAALVSEKVIRGERIDLDTKRKRKDGTLIDVSILGAPIIYGGKQIGDYAIYRDITQRKKAEEELLIQKAYFERLFNNAPEAIVLHDNNDQVINVNPEFTKMFGYSREEAIGRPINELVSSKEFQDEAAALSGKVVHGERVEIDTKRKRKDGTLMDVWILGAPIIHESKQMGVYAIYRDITGRKKAEEELRIEKAYLEELFKSAPEAIVLHDNNDIVVNVNDEFTRMFGYSREEAVGKPINDLVASEEFKEHATANSYRVIHGQRTDNDSKRKRKDGTLFDVWIIGAPIMHDDKQMGVYAIYRDITERKKAEEARIRLSEEARMAKNIQMNFLPKSNPEIPGYDIVGKSIPASNVGGDYYDFIFLDDHQLAISLGDVSGNGLAAALVMANLQATIRGQALSGADPDKCLERANKLLFRSTDARTFVSLFYGILDTRKHTLKYANAGQDLPILFSVKNRPIPLKTRGIALGMMEEVSYEIEEIAINYGNRLLIYSDGIREAMNEQKEEFGDEKLQQIVQRNRDGSAEALIKKIIAVVNSHFGNAPQNDDITMVLLIRNN